MHCLTLLAYWRNSAPKTSAFLLASLMGSLPVMAQTPLLFNELLSQASASYPALQAARLDKRAALEELEAARRLNWPTVSGVAESSTRDGTGSSANRSLQVEQTLWDAGNVKSKIAESQSITDIQALKALLLQEEVYLQLANAWQNMLASKERMDVAQQTITRLQNYQQQMQRRVKIEASPRIDLELANSRILQTQVEYATAHNSLRQALTRMEQYTGRRDLMAIVSSNGTPIAVTPSPAFAARLQSTDWQAVVDKHPAIAKAKAESLQSQNRLDQKKSETWPQLYARINQPLSKPAPGNATGPTAFVGLRYTTSAGFNNQIQAQALATRVASTEELIKAAATDLRQTLQVDQDEYLNAQSRIESLEKSVQGADLVLVSYQRQFQAGKKSWQDLLNAVRELAQNQYVLADARASLQGAMYRLQIRAGQDVK
jgi:adhesin transport system outer membrane protein